MLQCSRIGARHGRNPCPRAKGRRAASFFQTVRRRSAVPALQTAEATRTILSTASASVQACSRFRRKKFIGVMEWKGRRSWVAGQMETKCKSPTVRHWHRGHSANRVTKSLVLSERIGVPPIILATHQILCMCQREVGHKVHCSLAVQQCLKGAKSAYGTKPSELSFASCSPNQECSSDLIFGKTYWRQYLLRNCFLDFSWNKTSGGMAPKSSHKSYSTCNTFFRIFKELLIQVSGMPVWQIVIPARRAEWSRGRHASLARAMTMLLASQVLARVKSRVSAKAATWLPKWAVCGQHKKALATKYCASFNLLATWPHPERRDARSSQPCKALPRTLEWNCDAIAGIPKPCDDIPAASWSPMACISATALLSNGSKLSSSSIRMPRSVIWSTQVGTWPHSFPPSKAVKVGGPCVGMSGNTRGPFLPPANLHRHKLDALVSSALTSCKSVSPSVMTMASSTYIWKGKWKPGCAYKSGRGGT